MPLPEERVEDFAELLKALASTARLKLVNILAGGEHTVTELCELTGLKQSLVSQQLRILKLNNIVEKRKEVPHTFYRLSNEHVREILICLRKCRSIKE